MRNMKFKRPTAEEVVAGHGYTPEERDLIDAARSHLRSCEWSLQEANDLWRSMFGLTLPGDVIRAHQLVTRAKWNRHEARNNLRAAQKAYWEAVHPQRLRLYRLSRLLSGFITERLNQPSFAERILLPDQTILPDMAKENS